MSLFDKTKYFKHLMMLFSGTAIAQVFNFASYPFLTRIYSPDDFGIFTIFLTVVLITSAVSCARFDAIVTISKSYERITVYKISILLNLFISIFIGLTAFLISNFFDSLLSLLLGISVFLTAFNVSTSFLLLKHDGYGLNSTSLVIKSAFTAVPQILLFFVFKDAFGLIIGFVAGCMVQTLFLYFIFVKNFKNLFSFSLRKFHYIFHRYKNFIYYDVPSVLLSTTSFNIINFLIVDLFSTKEVGFYGMAYRLAAVPLAIFSNSLSQVFFQKASSAMELNGHFWNEFKYNLLLSSTICLTIISIMIFTVKPLVIFYLGENWETSADIIIYLSPLLATRFVSISVANAFLVLKRPKVLLINNAFLLSVGIIMYSIFKNLPYSFDDFVYFYSLSMSAVYLIFIIIVIKESKKAYLIKL